MLNLTILYTRLIHAASKESAGDCRGTEAVDACDLAADTLVDVRTEGLLKIKKGRDASLR